MVGVLLVADLYAHHRVERSVGVNRQGYRGPVAGRKQPGETRVVMLGGSTVFGYDVEWDDTIPAALERQLRAHDPKARVINLGFIGEGALAFVPTLESYSYLDYDVVCLYEGYNDVLGDAEPNRYLLRHSSPVFRLTGYFPILPLVLREKADDAAARQRGGRLSERAVGAEDGVPAERRESRVRGRDGNHRSRHTSRSTVSSDAFRISMCRRVSMDPVAPRRGGTTATPWRRRCASRWLARRRWSWSRSRGCSAIAPSAMRRSNARWPRCWRVIFPASRACVTSTRAAPSTCRARP